MAPKLHKTKRSKSPKFPIKVNAPIMRSGRDCWVVRLKRCLQASWATSRPSRSSANRGVGSPHYDVPSRPF